MNCILELQSDFFKTGNEHLLKPMKLMDVAEKIQMDISTVSRVTNSKYIETPYGTFLLKEFFLTLLANMMARLYQTKW